MKQLELEKNLESQVHFKKSENKQQGKITQQI